MSVGRDRVVCIVLPQNNRVLFEVIVIDAAWQDDITHAVDGAVRGYRLYRAVAGTRGKGNDAAFEVAPFTHRTARSKVSLLTGSNKRRARF